MLIDYKIFISFVIFKIKVSITGEGEMSLRMQVEKKKAQEEMRRLMAERKNKNKKPFKIDNPLAKYNNSGQLTCILCSSIVKSEHVWQVHINSKQHRQNIEEAKKLKELTNNFTKDKIKLKRSGVSIDGPEEKRPKGILKNANQTPLITPALKNNAPTIISHHDDKIIRKSLLPASEQGDFICLCISHIK